MTEPVKNKSKAKLQERQSKSAYLQIYLSSKNIKHKYFGQSFMVVTAWEHQLVW